VTEVGKNDAQGSRGFAKLAGVGAAALGAGSASSAASRLQQNAQLTGIKAPAFGRC
jgi:hypothetical protein